MLNYLVKRIALAAVVLAGVSVITFAMIYFLPTDPARMYAGPHASKATVARIREQMGLNDPIYIQYGRYMGRLVQGDLGYSYDMQMPVTQAIISRLPYTLELIAGGIIVEIVLGVPAGIIAALRKNSWIDGGSTLFALLGVSAPRFWIGLLLLYYFAFKLGLFPLGGAHGFSSLVLPAFAAGIGGVGWYARMTRSSVLEVLGADYIRTAYAKGLSEWRAVTKHVLRNALNPVVSMAGQDVPWFVGNVVVVAMVFSWPGIGRMAVQAILQDDIPLILGAVTFTAVLVVISSLLVDIVQSWLDPRIRLE